MPTMKTYTERFAAVQLATEREATERPDYCDDEHLEYLDALRESGATNMFGAGDYLREEFGMERSKARQILSYWMKTFSERHSITA